MGYLLTICCQTWIVLLQQRTMRHLVVTLSHYWSSHINIQLFLSFAAIFKATDNTTVGSNITLPCKNETNGEFFGVIWKHIFADGLVVEAFAYYVDTGYSVHKSIVDRSKLVNGTSLRIQNIRISDGGPYSCSIIYFKRDPDSQSVIPVARIKSEIDLVIVGMLKNLFFSIP